MNIYEVVKKLTGEVEPVGETHLDDKRYGNLKQLTELTEQLLVDICNIEYRHKNSPQSSLKRAAKHCSTFLGNNGIVNE